MDKDIFKKELKESLGDRYIDGSDVKYIQTTELHTFACNGLETYIGGTDDNGNEITIAVCTYQLLRTLDIPYMKEKLNDYINKINTEKK
jgi:hypothetical protein